MQKLCPYLELRLRESHGLVQPILAFKYLADEDAVAGEEVYVLCAVKPRRRRRFRKLVEPRSVEIAGVFGRKRQNCTYFGIQVLWVICVMIAICTRKTYVPELLEVLRLDPALAIWW